MEGEVGEVGEEVSLEEKGAAGPGRMAGFGALVGARQDDAGAGAGKGGQQVGRAPWVGLSRSWPGLWSSWPCYHLLYNLGKWLYLFEPLFLCL